MNERWDLTGMYRGFEDPAFEADLQKFQEIVKDFGTFTEKLGELDPQEALKTGFSYMESMREVGEKLMVYAALRQSADTKDPAAGSNLGRILAVDSQSAGPQAAFSHFMAELPDLDARMERDPVLREYRFLAKEARDNDRYLLGTKGEEIASRMKLSGSNAWSDLQAYLTSSVAVDYGGGVTNLSAIRNLAYSADKDVRKAAYEAELRCYDKIKDPVAYALNSIKLETISQCHLRGYESPLDKTLRDSRMSRATLDACHGREPAQVLEVSEAEGQGPGPRERPALVRSVCPHGRLRQDLHHRGGPGLPFEHLRRFRQEPARHGTAGLR